MRRMCIHYASHSAYRSGRRAERRDGDARWISPRVWRRSVRGRTQNERGRDEGSGWRMVGRRKDICRMFSIETCMRSHAEVMTSKSEGRKKVGRKKGAKADSYPGTTESEPYACHLISHHQS